MNWNEPRIGAVLLVVSLVLAALAAAPATATHVERHGLSSDISAAGPADNTTVFTPDDEVFAWMYADEPVAWDDARWVFSGPSDVTYVTNGSGDQAGGHHYGTLDLRGYDPDTIVGQWTVTAYVDGELKYSESFTVERLYPWWMRYGAVALGVGLVAIVALTFVTRRR